MLKRAALAVALAATLAIVAAPGAHAGTAAGYCGDATTDNHPDTGPDALKWTIVHAFPSDVASAFAQLAPGIVVDVFAIDQFFKSQDPTRAPRWDFASFPGCPTTFGQLDMVTVQLPNPQAFYQADGTTLDGITDGLEALGVTDDPTKKHLVYYQGAVDNQQKCGEGNSGVRDGGTNAIAAVYLGACGAVVGTGTSGAAITAAHEMVHQLNVLPVPLPSPGPPNVCSIVSPVNNAGDDGHPCDSVQDLMFPVGMPGDTLQTRILDVGRDDYWGHAGSWSDAQDSLFLSHLDSADVTAPGAPKRFTATGQGDVATVSWSRSRDASGVRYRIYQDGDLLVGKKFAHATTKKRKINLSTRKTAATARKKKRKKRTIRYGIQAIDGVGQLSPLKEILFKVGVGIVNSKGKLIDDTVPPPGVKLRPASISAAGLLLRWRKVRDTGGPLKGYRIERNKRKFVDVTRKKTSQLVPAGRTKGKWTVRAIDKAGNLGPRLQTLRVT
ncbi:MAG: hypothetical protein ACE5EV_06545 [Gaiellales bacterium]